MLRTQIEVAEAIQDLWRQVERVKREAYYDIPPDHLLSSVEAALGEIFLRNDPYFSLSNFLFMCRNYGEE